MPFSYSVTVEYYTTVFVNDVSEGWVCLVHGFGKGITARIEWSYIFIMVCSLVPIFVYKV